jgi:hypothetical protein
VRGQSAAAGVEAPHRTDSSFLCHIGKASCQIGRIWLLRQFGTTLIVRLLFVVALLPQCSRYVRRSLGARPLEGGFPADPFLIEGLRLGAWRVLVKRGPAWRSGLANTLQLFALLAHVALEADVVVARVGIPRCVGCSRWASRPQPMQTATRLRKRSLLDDRAGPSPS